MILNNHNQMQLFVIAFCLRILEASFPTDVHENQMKDITAIENLKLSKLSIYLENVISP